MYTTRVADALDYARRGWPVLPLHSVGDDGRCTCGKPDCASPGKHPRTRRGVHDATTDEARVRAWWAEWPDANIGIRTGKASGLLVLDEDPRHGGSKSLRALEERHGPLPESLHVHTGGQGTHRYFANGDGSVRSQIIAPGLEIKGEGSYAVAPPSVTEREYVLDPCCTWDDPIAPPPAWLAAMLSDGSQRELKSLPDRITEGQRNKWLASLAGSMRNRNASESIILAALKAANEERCDPPLSESEIRDIAGSISQYPPGAIELHREAPHDSKPAKPQVTRASNEASGGALQKRKFPSSSSSPIAGDGDDDLNSAPVELCSLAKPGPRQWVVAGFIPANAPTTLFGSGGLAKSLLGMLVADCVARGQSLFGRAVQQGRVLYLDWELDREEQTRRAYRVAAGLDFPSPAPGLFYKQMTLPLSEALPQIEGWLKDLQISLTIMDSFGLATLGDPTAAKDVVPLLAGVSRLPCTSLFIDHVRNLQPGEKGTDLNPFGSVYKFNIPRSVLRVIRVAGDEISLSLLLRQTKSNFGALSDPLGLRVAFEEDKVLFEQLPLSSPVFAEASDYLPACEKVHQALLAAEEASPKELAEETGLRIGTVKNQLTRLRGQGKAEPVGGGRWKAVEESSSSFPLSDDDDDNSAVGKQLDGPPA